MASISVDLPPEIYDHRKREAERSQRTLEAVMIENLGLMAGTASAAMDVQDTFSDEKLWAIVHQHLSAAQIEQKNVLIDKHPRSDEEQAELDQLIDLSDDLVILRSKALVLLKERGHDINAYLASSDHAAFVGEA